jgi:hypothetical protein
MMCDNCTSFIEDPISFIENRDALAKHAPMDVKLPKFCEWTLIDVMQNRIYATFDNDVKLAGFLKRNDLSEIAQRILADRVIAATSSRIKNMYERHELTSLEYICLMKGSVRAEMSTINPVTWSVINYAEQEVESLYKELYNAGVHNKEFDAKVELSGIF